MVFASGPGPLAGDIPPGITLSSLQSSFYTLLGCLVLLLIALFLMGLALRKESTRFWQRKLAILVAAMNLLALISVVWAWFTYQSFAQYDLPLSANYFDWYVRYGQGVADQLESAVAGFGTWSILFSVTTIALLCVVGEHLITNMRARQPASRRGIPSHL